MWMALTVSRCPPPGPVLCPSACPELLLNILWGFLPRCPWLLLLPGGLYAPPQATSLACPPHQPDPPGFPLSLSFLGLLDTLLVPKMLTGLSLPQPQPEAHLVSAINAGLSEQAILTQSTLKGASVSLRPAHRVTVLLTKGQPNSERFH